VAGAEWCSALLAQLPASCLGHSRLPQQFSAWGRRIFTRPVSDLPILTLPRLPAPPCSGAAQDYELDWEKLVRGRTAAQVRGQVDAGAVVSHAVAPVADAFDGLRMRLQLR
jgi:hypothetical protein